MSKQKVIVNADGEIPDVHQVLYDLEGEPYSALDATGAEVLDPTPMEPPLGYNAQPTLADQIRMAVLSEKLAEEMRTQGMETFEEADDFDVGDDYDISSPWENDFDPPFAEIAAEVGRLAEKGVDVPEETVDRLERAAKDPVREDPKPKKATKQEAKKEDVEGND